MQESQIGNTEVFVGVRNGVSTPVVESAMEVSPALYPSATAVAVNKKSESAVERAPKNTQDVYTGVKSQESAISNSQSFISKAVVIQESAPEGQDAKEFPLEDGVTAKAPEGGWDNNTLDEAAKY